MARYWELITSLDPSTFKKLRGYIDVIINTVSVVLDFNKYMKLVGLDGTMVLVGLPEGAISVGPFSLTSAHRSLAGSAVGGFEEHKRCLISVASITLPAT
jgi:alcohol dehydrogenase (NADP+)